MNKYLVEGGRKLSGEIFVQGAKNSALPILAASILADSASVIRNCPNLSDVTAAVKILDYLGCKTEMQNNILNISPESVDKYYIPDGLMREMRSSIVFLGAILTKFSKARLSFPGGCELGPRPIDLHLMGLRRLGAQIAENHGYLECSIPNGRLKGASVYLSFPSVGATENIMIAASLAKGETVISNAAREPEIIDLADYLNACGARVRGAGESIIAIDGVETLYGCEHKVIPDRIAAATYLCAGAATRGDILLRDIDHRHLRGILPVLEQAGCEINTGDGQSRESVRLKCAGRPKSFQTIRTLPYPGFPTDAQPPLMALASVAEGTAMFVENIFENRYKHVDELRRFGANIKAEGRVAVVEGVEFLQSAQTCCTDLRGGAALLIAALCARGISEIRNIHHIERGYEAIDQSLGRLGASIKKVEE